MAIIYQHDKRSGITYAYESHSYWDKEKKTSRARRTLIGRVDPKNGEIVATDGRGRKEKTDKALGDNSDYQLLYKKQLKKCASQEKLIAVLKEELSKIKRQET